MKPGQASVTAQRVAAHRLTFTRVTARYGDPAADDALARDVAASASAQPGPRREYLRARTRFFDGVVTRALHRGCTQGVIGAAGYDGRALAGEEPRHSFLVGHLARAPGGDLFLVLGDGGVGLGLVQFARRCAVLQGLQCAVLVRRGHYSGFTAEMDDAVTVML